MVRSRMTDGLITTDATRCAWCGELPDYIAYHDDEWGHPTLDDRRLFEKICLEGFQSGLSWLTILRKREAFRAAFDDFDFERVARYRPAKVERLLNDAGIIRHRGKIEATINNAQRAVALAEELGALAPYFWSWEPGPDERPQRMNLTELKTMTTCPSAKAMSKDLKRRGWKFVGPTTAYAFMQAMGLVNDHLEGCAYREPIERARTARRVETVRRAAAKISRGP